MILSDIIGQRSYSQVEKIARSAVWSHTDMEAWLTDIPLTLNCARAGWSKLDEHAGKVLETIVRRFGPLPFLEETLLHEAGRGMTGSACRLGLLDLAEAGIVFAVRRGWGERLYFLPRDMFYYWHRIINEAGVQPLPEQAAMWSDKTSPPLLSLQLLHTLAELKRCGMKCTAKGILPKRTINKCGAHIAFKQSGALELMLGKSSGFTSDGYPLPLAMMLDLAIRCGLLGGTPAALFIRENNLEQWLHLPAEERERKLLRIVMEQYAARSAVCARAAARLSGLPELQWHEAADADLQPWCELMAQTGWMELADTWEGKQAFRWLIPSWPYERSAAAASGVQAGGRRITIAADGNIYVPPYVSAALRWQLELIAERGQSEPVAVYRINERSLKTAAELGYSGRQITELLEAESGERLPDLVHDYIANYMKGAERRSEQLLNRSYGGEAAGMEPESLPVFLPEPDYCGQYELCEDYPSPQSLFRGLEETPANWLRCFRNYHHTTRKEMLERALFWRIAVKLKYGGDEISFVPERIEAGEDGWSVAGYTIKDGSAAAMRLSPNMWQEMMLEFPQSL